MNISIINNSQTEFLKKVIKNLTGHHITNAYSFFLQQDNVDPQDPVLTPFGTITKVRILRGKKLGKEYNLEEPIWETEKWCIFSPSEGAQWHFHQGCSEPLKDWVNSSGDILFVLGFCVIAFLKFTFLGK